MLIGETRLVLDLTSAMKAPRLRTLGEFAEQEIILPDGPRVGRRFRLDVSPVARLLFDELDSGRWPRAFITGPNQDGKSLIGFVIPTMHMLFERKEPVIMGVKSLDMAADKWKLDILPAIRASRYRDLLPTSGSGSRGGDPTLIQFRNGVPLRFMCEGGDDQSRAAFTSPNLVVTETDGFDTVGSSSREGDKFSQLERRLLAFGNQARTLAECTVSIEQGRTWQEYTHGTQSRIAIPCPHCGKWVTPEREHLVGWQDAEDELEAVAGAYVVCPDCGSPWSNEERIYANARMILVHRGQTVTPEGLVVGPLPRTRTLGFRWNAVNVTLNPDRLSLVGGAEWKLRRSVDEERDERDLLQKEWAMPGKPDKADISKVDAMAITARTLKDHGRGVVPADTVLITVGCDVGRWLCHWVAIAWRPKAAPHVIDYGRVEVLSATNAEEEAIMLALRSWRDSVLAEGWGGHRSAMTFVDAGYLQDTVIRFCDESPGCLPTKGFGVGQRATTGNKREGGSTVVQRYDHYAEVKLPDGQTYVEIDANYWKAWLQARIRTPVEQPSAFTLFEPGEDLHGKVDRNEHLSIAKHLTAERQTERFVPGTGTVVKFEQLSRNNHYGDAAAEACAAGHAAGIRLAEIEVPTPPADHDEPSPSAGFVDSWKGRY